MNGFGKNRSLDKRTEQRNGESSIAATADAALAEPCCLVQCLNLGTGGVPGSTAPVETLSGWSSRMDSRNVDTTAIVDRAITSRRSVRAFLPTPVSEQTVREILDVAARAPSGTNMQPWKVYVVTGDTRQSVADAILNSGVRAEKADWDEYRYYPTQFFEPYLSRRRAVGYALYGLLGIGRRDIDRIRAQHDRNFVFFDAPVGMIFTIDRELEKGSWLDCGMFLENIAIAARGRGLHSCAQAAFAPYHRLLRPLLGIAEREIVICGMALGYEDESRPENRLRTERAPLDDWAVFLK